MNRRVALMVAALLTQLLIETDGHAQQWNDPAYDFKLGAIDHFQTEAEASKSCKGDAVVWADQYTTFYYPKYLKEYKNTGNGTFTCFKSAKEAGYWGIGATEGLEGSGREFPVNSCQSCY